MQLSDFLTPDRVKAVSSISSKKRLFHELGEMAASCLDASPDDVVRVLMERETLGPTGVGRGVALPHGRLPGLTRVSGLFIRIERPVEFDAVDRKPVDLVFALLAPAEAGVEHLKALAAVSRMMREPAFCTKLRANDNPATLYTILTEDTTSAAA